MFSRLFSLLGLSPTTVRRLRYPSIDRLLSVRPKSDHWGWDRGTPVDRYYIERFLADHAGDVRGNALEVKDADYTKRYGHDLVRTDILDIDAANPQATIVADLATGEGIPESSFDCFVLTQTLQCVYDTRAALGHASRILRPGGVLLATVPTVSRAIRKFEPIRDYWRFTPAACTQLFADRFGQHRITVRAYGNILTSIAFLTGMAAEELSEKERERDDPDFPLLVTIRAVKAGSSGRGRT